MGRRKLEITPDQYPEVEKLAAVLNSAQIADFFGMAERTFRNRRSEDPELDAAYKRGRANALAKVGASLLGQALDGNTTAAIFYLKTQAGWSERVQHEHSGPDGGPVDFMWTVVDPKGGDEA